MEPCPAFAVRVGRLAEFLRLNPLLALVPLRQKRCCIVGIFDIGELERLIFRQIQRHLKDLRPELLDDYLAADGHARIAANRNGRLMAQERLIV